MINEHNNNSYNSCCFKIDKEILLFIITSSIVLSSIALSIFKLITSKSCEQQTPYYIMLSNISGLAGGVLFSFLKKHNRT